LWNGINEFYLGIIAIILEATRNNCPKNLITLPGSLRDGEMSNDSLSFLSAVSRQVHTGTAGFWQVTAGSCGGPNKK
jgi:hypothetical protein